MIIQFLPSFPAAQQTFSHLASLAKQAVGLVNQEKFHALRRCLTSQGVEFTRMNIRNLCMGYKLYKPESVRLPSLFRMTRFQDKSPLEYFQNGVTRNMGIDAGLSECLTDLQSEEETRELSAIFDLGLYGDSRVNTLLVDHVMDQGKQLVRGYLGVLPLAEAKEWALTHLDDPTPEIRGIAIDASGELKDAQAVPVLIQILRTRQDHAFHGHAIYALGKIGDQRSVPTLIEMLRIPKLRNAARWALEKIDDHQAKSVTKLLIQMDINRFFRRALYDTPYPVKPKGKKKSPA